jgi:hypothetical protein
MNNPIHIRVSTTISGTSKSIGFSGFPDEKYVVEAIDFDFNAGNWWITNKVVGSFTLNWENSADSNNVDICLYYDADDRGS